jgi:CheY-like chemotaxis protein
MIEEILDHDRIVRGKVRLQLEPAPINDIATTVVESWQARLSNGFPLSIQLDPACGVLDFDMTRIRQVLNNFIDNAVKYSPDGGAIQVSTHALQDEVWVSVQDEGMGMSPEAKKAIFERFAQLESGADHRAGGLGIGLALVNDLIELHGGRTWVESEKGKGSTFTFALPRVQKLAQGDPADDGDADERENEINPWDKCKVLFVDDLEHYHRYMELLMTSSSKFSSAYNGQEAIDAVRREIPDLILMDLRMPVMDGFDATKQLKSDLTTKDIPILAVTAQAMENDRMRSAQAGANGFITKPIDIEVFKKEVGRVLGVKV